MTTKPFNKAVQFQAPEGAEVSGIILLAYLNNLTRDVTEPILANYGFTEDELDSDKWYPNQMFLDIEKTIHESSGGQTALVAIGKSAAENYIPPKGADSLEATIEALPNVYTTNQRNLPDGYGWLVEKIKDRHYRFTNNTGTTNYGAYGYVWAICIRMKGSNSNLKITPQNDLDSTEPAIIDITW